MVTQRDIIAVIEAMEEAKLAPLTIKTHWSVIKAFFGWLFEEDVLTVSPIAKASVSADAVLDRVREIVVPDFRFIAQKSEQEVLTANPSSPSLLYAHLLETIARRRTEPRPLPAVRRSAPWWCTATGAASFAPGHSRPSSNGRRAPRFDG
ncbi:MAG: hypothetical protein ABSH29_23425, partial [Acidimicrobiales bacterium]